MYVILGATGNTGSAAADALLNQKKPVRVVVRSAEKGAPWKARGAEVAVASLEDVPALTAAFRGATGAYVLVPPDFTAKDVIGRGRRIIDTLAAALGAAQVPHTVLLSSIAAHLPEGTGVVRQLHYGEQKIGALPGAFTSVRAGYFMENWGGVLPVAQQNGILPSGLAADRKVPMIATKDIGTVVAAALLDPPASGRKIIELAGPVDLTPVEVAAAVSKALGKPVANVQISLDDMKKAFVSMGASQDIADNFAELIDGFNTGRSGFEGKGATLVRGATSIDTVLAGLLKGGGRAH